MKSLQSLLGVGPGFVVVAGAGIVVVARGVVDAFVAHVHAQRGPPKYVARSNPHVRTYVARNACVRTYSRNIVRACVHSMS